MVRELKNVRKIGKLTKISIAFLESLKVIINQWTKQDG